MIAAVDELHERGNSSTVRWTPAHAGVEGNEQADEAARHAAEEGGASAGHSFLREASLSHLMRKTTEARSQTTSPCPVMQPRPYTSSEWVRPPVTSAGGVAVVKDRPAIISW